MFEAPWWLIHRTRLLNVANQLGLANAYSQMVESERKSLADYAKGKSKALEVGTLMGVSAVIIAKALSENGEVYCVDPFPERKGEKNPGLSIAERILKRAKVFHKVIFLMGFSTDPKIKDQIPSDLDFIFIDGDHSYEGLTNDWDIVKKKLKVDGIVCLHDTIVPEGKPWRTHGSVSYYNDHIVGDKAFELIHTVHSMTVLKRVI